MLRVIGLVLTLAAAAVVRADGGPASARIALIIDDMGYRHAEGERALALPGPVTFAFLPHTPHGGALLERARRLSKEVVLHVPMQATAGRHALGPGALTSDMSRARFERTLDRNLAEVPRAIGISNHMGSLLTRETEPMDWLMQWLRRSGLAFIDSRTTASSVAVERARRLGVPVIERDVFLDNQLAHDAIRAQFERLVAHALIHGQALGIAHPHAQTLDVLEVELASLPARGLEIVPVSRLLPEVAVARLRAY